MAIFKLDIRKLREETRTFQNKYSKFQEICSDYFLMGDKLDSVWHDKNTLPFLDILKQEKNDIQMFSNTNGNYVNEIFSFADNIESIFSQNGLTKSDFLLDYNHDNCVMVFSILKDAMNKLSSIIKQFGDDIPRSSSAYYDIMRVKSKFEVLSVTLEDISKKIQAIDTGISQELSASKGRFSNVEKNNLIRNHLNYQYEICTPSADLSEIFTIKASKANLSSNDYTFQKDMASIEEKEYESLSNMGSTEQLNLQDDETQIPNNTVQNFSSFSSVSTDEIEDTQYSDFVKQDNKKQKSLNMSSSINEVSSNNLSSGLPDANGVSFETIIDSDSSSNLSYSQNSMNLSQEQIFKDSSDKGSSSQQGVNANLLSQDAISDADITYQDQNNSLNLNNDININQDNQVNFETKNQNVSLKQMDTTSTSSVDETKTQIETLSFDSIQ